MFKKVKEIHQSRWNDYMRMYVLVITLLSYVVYKVDKTQYMDKHHFITHSENLMALYIESQKQLRSGQENT